MSNLAAQELQSFVRRIENLDDEIRALNADKSEVFKEVKSSGFTAKTLRKVVAARRMDAAERDEADTEFELYWNAVHGIEIDHVRAHVENIEEFPVEHDADGVFPDETVPSVEGIKAPHQMVAADANAGGLNDLNDARSDTVETLDDRADDQSLGSDVEAVAPSNVSTLRQPAPLRPNCLNRDKCGGQGRNHCWSCQKAMNERASA